MNRLFKVTVLLALAVGLFGIYHRGAAQEDPSSKGRGFPPFPKFAVENTVESNSIATNHALERNYNSHGEAAISVANDVSTAIGSPLTVQCPGTSGTCTIQADMWIQNGGGSASNNENRVCLYVDGNPSAFCDFFAGETPTDGSFVQSTSSQSVAGVEHGNHTVQMYFLSSDGAAVGYYNANYRVYKP